MAVGHDESATGQREHATDAALALELRRLRESRGLTQHEMAKRLGLSARSAIADYESGRRKPPTDILDTYEGVFELQPGTLRELRDRGLAEQARQRYVSALAELAPIGAGTGTGAGAGTGVGRGTEAPRRRNAPPPRSMPPTAVPPLSVPPTAADTGRPRVHVRRTMVATAAVVLIGTTLAGSAAAVNSPDTHLDATWTQRTQNITDNAEPSSSPEPMDGDDPRARDCSADETTELTAPMYLPGGKAFGTLRLRHSAHCGASWGSAYYANPDLYTVRIIVHRPADGAEIVFDWSNNTPPGSYSDMLSTGTGCVWVEAEVTTPKGTSAPARTGCSK